MLSGLFGCTVATLPIFLYILSRSVKKSNHLEMGMDRLVIYKEAKPLAISLYQFYIGEMLIKYQISNTAPPPPLKL